MAGCACSLASKRSTAGCLDRVCDDAGSITLRVQGRLHHIGIGRTHARTPVIILAHDLHVRVVNATTGELLRELTIDQNRDYQPQNKENS